MKKILILFIMLFTSLQCPAITMDSTKDGNVENFINQVGFKLLNRNRIPYRIVFYYDKNSKVLNAYSSNRDMSITIYKKMILTADNEDEVAAVLAHEISHSVDSSQGLMKGYFSALRYSLAPKKYELKADKCAVDYMVNAGYNPLAMITMYTKCLSQPRYDYFNTHPLSSKRLMAIYEYIFNKYPAFLANNKMEKNIYYQNFLLTSENNRKKLQNKIESQSNVNIKYE